MPIDNLPQNPFGMLGGFLRTLYLKINEMIAAINGGSPDPTTSSNVGTGTGLAEAKIGTNLPFKSVKAGTNMSLDNTDPDTIVFNASGGMQINRGQINVTTGTTSQTVPVACSFTPLLVMVSNNNADGSSFGKADSSVNDSVFNSGVAGLYGSPSLIGRVFGATSADYIEVVANNFTGAGFDIVLTVFGGAANGQITYDAIG